MDPSNKHLGLYETRRDASWARLRTELFQCDLIAPMDVNPNDIQFSRRMIVYRLMLILMAGSVAIITLEGSLTAQLNLPGLWSAGIVLVLLGATLVHAVVRDRILIPPVVSLAFTIAVVMLAIWGGAMHHTLWLFPLMIAMAGLLPTSVALVMGVLTLLLLVYLRGLGTSAEDLAEDTALVATWLLSLAVMRLMTRQSDELADLALTDPLTGAYNRRYLMPQIQRGMADFQRYSRLSSLMMLDIDHFKAINDRLGHAKGDVVLKEMVKFIDQRIRGVDMLFRMGGEEFVVVLSEVGSATAGRIADELRVAISELPLLSDQEVTVSIGVCDVTQAESAEDWLHKADLAMYSAKQNGRNRVWVVQSEASPDLETTTSVPVWR